MGINNLSIFPDHRSEGAVIEARVGEGRLEATPGVDLDERGVKLVVNGSRAFAQHRVALFVHKLTCFCPLNKCLIFVTSIPIFKL